MPCSKTTKVNNHIYGKLLSVYCQDKQRVRNMKHKLQTSNPFNTIF